MRIESCKLIVFAPDHWGELQRFQHLHAGTYKWNRDTHYALSGASNHFRKANALLRVACEHLNKISEDREQIKRQGYSPAHRGEEISALIESVILNLYSSVDCTRKVVTFIYRNHRGVKQSAREFFQAVQDGKVADTVPAEIRSAFTHASWYGEFRRCRDDLTHSDVGSCHLDEKSGKVFYMHEKLGTAGKAFIIDDILSYVDGLVQQINQFFGSVFKYLNSTLSNDEVYQICGLFGGRVYTRYVRPIKAADFSSGRCDAFQWFDKPENPACPFKDTCGAYQRRNSGQSSGPNG